MKKILLVILVGTLIISGVQAVDIAANVDENENNLVESFVFSAPVINDEGQYVKLQLQETELALRDPGKPEMPMVTYSFDLPFGAKNVKITFTPSDEFEIDLTKKIIPTSQPVFGEVVASSEIIEDSETYSSIDRYPENWYEVKITSGLKSNKNRVTHVSLYMFPVQYSPALNKAYCINEATVQVSYNPPDQVLTFQEEYDLVIIAPEKFSSLLQRLVDHKNSINVETLLMTTEEIYDGGYPGVDKPEQIKYFIKDAIETYNIDYVLLVGGLKSLFYAKDRDDCNQGTSAWHVPVRYTNIKKTGLSDPGAISDLYYADIYDGVGDFSSWDSNEDGVFAKWTNTMGNDVLDLNPDVYVGRLPCRNKFQVRTVVNKIINYETTTPNTDAWFTRMIGISGLSHDLFNGQPDGEYLTDLAMTYVEDTIDDEVRVYASNADSGGPIPELKDISNAFTSGARFVYFSGHGNPLVWVTHPVDNVGEWMERIYAKNLWRFFNFKKLPIVVVGGCHDAQFNISLWTTFRSSELGDDQWYWTHNEPGAACFCWKLMLIPWGGAVATIGGTGLTTSYTSHPDTLNGRLATSFYYEIGQDGAASFGEAFAGATQKFIDENEINLLEAHAITIWNALGDPSLEIS